MKIAHADTIGYMKILCKQMMCIELVTTGWAVGSYINLNLELHQMSANEYWLLSNINSVRTYKSKIWFPMLNVFQVVSPPKQQCTSLLAYSLHVLESDL